MRFRAAHESRVTVVSLEIWDERSPPLEADLVKLCRELNQRGARYVVIGGFAIITAGLPRVTGDIDLIVAVDRENEANVARFCVFCAS